MSTTPTASANETATATSRGRTIKRIVVGVLIVPLAVFLVIELFALQAEQQTEQKRRSIAMVGGRIETERRVPMWLQSIAGPNSHSFLDRNCLVRVTMSGDKISDEQLATVQGLPDLVSLDLEDSLVTSAGMEVVAKLTSLESLKLAGSKVTDVAPLAQLPNLKTLILNFSDIRQEAFGSLAEFPSLRNLGASGLKLDDQGIELLAKCPHLEELSINGATLGEHGLVPLLAQKGLKFLSLKDAIVNVADVADFKKAMPGCKVVP
ncbi:leucine-rich repeat domain-containing protein [Schlesneria paludicola]|uniref:leucine-rich repeat domain-containing protein n=1 Tax=Schlesneria paludicola TaxID=360056 RepID=UPI00029B15C1|nr:ribonuclease inhibitor [Schlesneria paludicola]